MAKNEYLQEFIIDCKIRNLTERTIKSYRNNTNLFLRYTCKKHDISNIELITKIHVKDYISHCLERELAPSYINSIIKCLRAFFKYCKQEEYIYSNPMDKVNFVKEGKVLIQTFTDEEVKRMLEVYDYSNFINARNNAILHTFFDTGIRCLELCTIKNEDVKDNNTILINGKGRKERFVVASFQTLKALNKYIRIKNKHFYAFEHNPYLFVSKNNNQLTVEAVERVVRIAGEKAGIREDIRCSPHTCRHFFAQKCLENQIDVYSLARLLGHERIDITKRYLQSISDAKVFDIVREKTPLTALLKGGRR